VWFFVVIPINLNKITLNTHFYKMMKNALKLILKGEEIEEAMDRIEKVVKKKNF